MNNTVKLSLDDYLKLYNFRKNFESEHGKVLYNFYNYTNVIETYITESDAVNKISLKYESLYKELEGLTKKYDNLYSEHSLLLLEIKELEMKSIETELKNMSFWKRLKWMWRHI